MHEPSERAPRETIDAWQLGALRDQLALLLEHNAFYREKLEAAGVRDAATVTDVRELPFTTKRELCDDQTAHPPYGSALTFPLDRYVRVHQTSGTTGSPLRWLDTPESWAWFTAGWRRIYEAAGVGPEDRVFFAFSFGLFIGFWSAFDAARELGAMAIPGGGMTSRQRLRAIIDHRATVVCGTPTYALRLAEVAREEGIDLAASSVRVTIQAGEPGAGLPATRARIERAWGATCFDHAGATEVGPWGFECTEQAGQHLNEAGFVFEVIDPETDERADEGELVVTNLGRVGSPVIRYRTGDRVRLAAAPCPCGRTFARLDGGVIGRIDDALTIRGVSIFPSAIEAIVRAEPAIDEFAIDVHRRGALDELCVRIEAPTAPDTAAVAARVEAAIRDALALRVDVDVAAPGTLPRYELKARRVTDHRPA